MGFTTVNGFCPFYWSSDLLIFAVPCPSMQSSLDDAPLPLSAFYPLLMLWKCGYSRSTSWNCPRSALDSRSRIRCIDPSVHEEPWDEMRISNPTRLLIPFDPASILWRCDSKGSYSIDINHFMFRPKWLFSPLGLRGRDVIATPVRTWHDENDLQRENKCLVPSSAFN